MTTILKSLSSLTILVLSFTLVSMTPDKGTKTGNIKIHIVHNGERLCISKAAFDTHPHKHIGKVDCDFAGFCIPESASFHTH